jgi:hypothetical protein
MCITRLVFLLSLAISTGSSLSFWFYFVGRSAVTTQAIVAFHSVVLTVDRGALFILDHAVTDLALRELHHVVFTPSEHGRVDVYVDGQMGHATQGVLQNQTVCGTLLANQASSCIGGAICFFEIQ